MTRTGTPRLLALLTVAWLATAPAGCFDEDTTEGEGEGAVAEGEGEGEGEGAEGEGEGDAPLALTTIAELNARTAELDGRLVRIEGVATVASGVLAAGSYLKVHLQDDTGGVALFGDPDLAAELPGSEPATLAEVQVEPGDRLRVTGRVGSHDGLLELRPRAAADLELLESDQPLPAPRRFSSVAALYAADPAPVGSLVRIAGVQLADPTQWPVTLGGKAKDVIFEGTAGGDRTVGADLYAGSGIPGSAAPTGPLTLQGLLRRKGELLYVFPRSLADLDPLDERLSGELVISRYQDETLRWPVQLADVPAFRFAGRTSVLLADVLRAARVPGRTALRYKVVARDGRQPHASLPWSALSQGMLQPTRDAQGQPVAGRVDSTFLPCLALSEIYFLTDVDEVRSFVAEPVGVQEGEGPCADGINLAIEQESFFLPLAELPRATVTVAGAEVEAIALSALLPDAVLERYSFEGSFALDDLSVLYDFRLTGDATAGGTDELLLHPEQLAAGQLLVDGRRVVVPGQQPPLAELTGLCRVEARRRFLVSRADGAAGPRQATVYLDQLTPQTITTSQGEQLPGYDFAGLLSASGLLGQGEGRSAFDYRLISSDLRSEPDKAVRFPWGHGHLEQLRFVPALRRTVSLDAVGDLQDAGGQASYGGLQGHGGWSSVKVLLQIAVEPAPDPAHTVEGPDGPYTDPASCAGCHVRRNAVEIPVTCTQCHPR